MGGHHAYYDAAISLVFFLLVGRYLDVKTRSVAKSAAQELSALEPARANILKENGSHAEVPIDDFAVGDVCIVKPSERIPFDGVVIQGSTEVDRSILSGETIPESVVENGKVSAGEVNLTGLIHIRVTARSEDSNLHKISELVAIAEGGRNNYTSLADKAAKAYAPMVCGCVSFISRLVFSLQIFDLYKYSVCGAYNHCPAH